jgi:hypothetical protein
MISFVQENPEKNSLRDVSAALIQNEMKRKVHATSIVVRSVPLEPEASRLLQHLASLETTELDVSSRGASGTMETLRHDLTDTEGAMRAKLERLRGELNAFRGFSEVACTIFGSIASESDWKSVVAAGLIDDLARVRQSLEISSGITEFRLEKLHEKLDQPRGYSSGMQESRN